MMPDERLQRLYAREFRSVSGKLYILWVSLPFPEKKDEHCKQICRIQTLKGIYKSKNNVTRMCSLLHPSESPNCLTTKQLISILLLCTSSNGNNAGCAK